MLMQNNFSKCREWVPRGTSQHKWRWLTTLLLILTLGIGQMWADPAAMYANSFEGGTDSWGKSSMTSGPAEETTNVRTGGKSIKYVSSASLGYTTKSVSFVKNTKIHAILWVKASETKSVYLSLNSNNGTAVNVGSAGWTKVAHTYSYTSSTGNKNVRLYMNDKTANVSIYVDDVIMYSDAADTIDFTKPTAATLPNATTTSLSWTNGSDGAKGTGIQNTLIWKRTTSGTNNLSLNDQGVYAVNDVNGQWTLVNASVAGDETSYSGTFVSGEEYAIVHRDYAYNYSTPLYVTIPGGGGGGGDPVDPVFTYTPATYTIGDDPLDLSTKLSSTNTTGAITFAVSSTDAGTTGASIANSKNFTATTAGTAKVTVSQAASTGFNAKSQGIDVTVVAPDPCHKYFWFAKADDVPTGITNNENSFFGSTPGGSGSMTASITIDEVQYNITGRSSNATPNISFTVPANKSGKLYVVAQGSSNRSLVLKKGTTTIQTISWTTAKGDEFNPVGPGEYSLTCTGGNVGWGMLAVKVCDAEFHTITLDLDGGTGATSVQALDGAAATKPADPTKEHCTFAGWYKGADEYDWTTAVTTPFTLTAHWTQLYTVTYAAGDGTATGDAPTQADLAAGEKFNVAANTFAVAGKDFVKWNDGTSDYNPGQEYTMGSANVTLTAQWKAASAKYTVHYMDEDGTTPLAADELVEVTQKPAGLAEDPTKPLYTFAAWQLSGVDIALDATSWTSVPANTEVTLTARWAKAYAANIDFEAFIDANTTSGNWQNYLSTNNYAISNTADVSLDNQGTSKPADKGLKMKNHPGAYVSFNVNAGKLVLVKMGRVNGMDASVDGGANYAALNGSGSSEGASVINYLYNASEAEYRLKTTVNGYNIIQSITITDPYQVSFNTHGADAIAAATFTGTEIILPTPTNGTGSFKGWYDAETEGNKIGNAGASYTPTANITLHAQWETLSSDNTLASWKIDGVAKDVPVSRILYIEEPYGVTPVISEPVATANVGLETPIAEVLYSNTPVHYQSATEDFWYVQAEVHPQDPNAAIGYYQVRYTNAPKLGATIFRADLTAENAADFSGMYVDADNSQVALKKDGDNNNEYKFAGTSNFIKMALADATFAEGDMLKMTYSTNPQQAELAIYDGTTKLQGTPYTNHTMTFTDVVNGKSTLFIRRTNDNTFNGWVAAVEVQRYMNPIIKSFKIGAVSGTIDQDLKTISIELPYGTSLYGVAATIEAYANGGATVIAPTPLAYDTPLGYKVSSAYAEDGDVDYTVTITEAEHYEAKIGTTGYATLVAAVEAAQDGDVIVLQEDVTNGAGVMLTKTDAKEITIDFGGYTYTAVSPAVGSAGTQNQAFHLEKGNTVTLKNGTITSSGSEIKMLIQNYCDLTLENITLDGSGLEGAHRYVMSNNCGNVEIGDGTTITAKDGDVAFDVCATNYYPEGVTVTVKEGATISGIVEYDVWGTKPADNHAELAIEGGNFDVTWNVEAALAEDAKDNLNVSGGTFTAAVPADYCAEGYAPTNWTVGTETKYGVHLAGVIRGAASTNTDGVYYYTLDNGVTIYSSNSEGQLSTSTMTSTSSDVTACGGAEGGYNVNKSAFVLKFPVNVKEFTLYGANSTERTISKIYVNAEGSKTIKISTDGDELTGTYTNTKDGKCQALTAAFNDANIIPANYYVLVKLDGSVNFYRVLYTEAECTDPVINSIDATRMKVGETATVSVDASAIGATYQWYRCEDALGANPQIIDGATAASYSFTKAAGDEYFKVVVGCNCSAATVEDVVKAEEWYEVIRTNVTGYTEWSWNGVYDNETAGPTINQAQKGLVLASYIDAPNFDKLEGVNSAYVYRKNQYPAYQGTQLKFTTEVPGMLIIDASYTDNGNTFSVNGYPMGTLPKNHAKDTIAVKAGDVTITSQGIRIWAMTFDPDFSNYALTDNKATGYDRPVTEGRYGTICLPNGGVMTGAMLFDLAYFDPDQKKIFFDEVINGTMEAGTPYIFLPNEGVDALKVFYTDATAAAVAGNANGLFGSYTQEIVTPNDGNYILLNNQYCFVNSTAYVGANRAYIKLYGDGHALTASSTSAPQPAPGRRRVSMGVQGEQVATGIEGLNVGDQPIKVVIDGQMYILRGDKMYDATGRLVK